MNHREQLIEKASEVVYRWKDEPVDPWLNEENARVMAADVLDAILPQVSTVEELEALDEKTLMVAQEGWPVGAWAGGLARHEILNGRPLTVVWQP